MSMYTVVCCCEYEYVYIGGAEVAKADVCVYLCCDRRADNFVGLSNCVDDQIQYTANRKETEHRTELCVLMYTHTALSQSEMRQITSGECKSEREAESLYMSYYSNANN